MTKINNKNTKGLDIVVGGPDHSGTSTQIKDIIKYFQNKGLRVKDLRGTEIDILFHRQTEYIKSFIKIRQGGMKKQLVFDNLNLKSLEKFVKEHKLDILQKEVYKRIMEDLKTKKTPSMIKNDVSLYLNPNLADVWVMEEPSKIQVGSAIRSGILYASKFRQKYTKYEEALAYALDRKLSYELFRKPLLDAGKIILRSRSEESLLYQLYDKKLNPKGPKMKKAIDIEGNALAFENPTDYLFIVSGLERKWTLKDAKKLAERGKGKILDDKELNLDYQRLVGERYAQSMLEKMYSKAEKKFGSMAPQIHRFDIWKTPEEIKKDMYTVLDTIVK